MNVINIYGGSNVWVEAVLSNLAHTPFIFGDIYLASVEGFHQGIKYNDEQRQCEIFERFGVKAKSAGREANKLASGYVYWGRPLKAIEWQSKEYFDLYFDVLFAKFTQNEEAKSALIASGTSHFSHCLPNGEGLYEIDFQKTHLCQSLYCISDYIKGEINDIQGCKEKCSDKAVR